MMFSSPSAGYLAQVPSMVPSQPHSWRQLDVKDSIRKASSTSSIGAKAHSMVPDALTARPSPAAEHLLLCKVLDSSAPIFGRGQSWSPSPTASTMTPSSVSPAMTPRPSPSLCHSPRLSSAPCTTPGPPPAAPAGSIHSPRLCSPVMLSRGARLSPRMASPGGFACPPCPSSSSSAGMASSRPLLSASKGTPVATAVSASAYAAFAAGTGAVQGVPVAEVIARSPRPCISSSRFSAPPKIGEEAKAQGKLPVGELVYHGVKFDPTKQPLQSQLLTQLGACPNSVIEVAAGCAGGLNAGIWLLRSGADGKQEELILKLVRFDPFAPTQLVEAATFLKLADEFPDILEDQVLAFPHRIFHVRAFGGVRRHDLIVMRKAPGRLLADIVSEKILAKRTQELTPMLRSIGACLARFHRRYGGKQHCDFGPQNICFDEETGRTTFVDLGGMGNKVRWKDVERFCKILRRLAERHGAGEELEQGINNFIEGYDKASAQPH
eukprot:TRINITY_DN109421_c0_g1_i1.p1 TRINITY_DN109421_c0_g1~~TRINITY_DN109421_c0_g1_i1.p1  ORF type:complete len:493 (+),score=88.44 TRINITY_DN109421_c0_g1_i1:136-1614(+)